MKTILFQGDSITDCGREYNAENYNHPAQLGRGYVNCIASRLLLDNPNAYTIINKGISGNRVVDLYARWKIDGLNLNPDLISILPQGRPKGRPFFMQNAEFFVQ